MIDELYSTLTLLGCYRVEFQHMGIVPKKGGVALEHSAWMIEEMLAFLTSPGEDRRERLHKVNRWIGFVQGVLWKEGVFTIDQLRHHVISSRATVEELSNTTLPGVEH